MHRFFIPPNHIQSGTVRFPEDTARQMRSVLRLRPGEEVLALDGAGMEYRVRLTQLDGREAAGEVLEQAPARGEPRLRVTLYQCLTQREKFELILQKAVELGAAEIVPVISSRSLVRGVEEHDERKRQRWERIMTEAAEQSGRAMIPRLGAVCRLETALSAAAAAAELALFPWEEEQGLSLKQALDGSPASRLALFVGPEGGFSPEEARLARASGVRPVTLGPRILRVETAALAALAAVMYQMGEWER